MFRSKFSWFSRFTLLPRRVLHAPEQSIAYCLTRYKPLQAKKSEKRGIHRPRIKKTLLRSKNPLVLNSGVLPAARRDFASQKSDVRLLTWLHAAAFGVAVGAPPLPRPVVAQQLRASVPPPRPLSRAAFFCGVAACQRLAVVAPVPAPSLCAPMGSRPRRSRCPACALCRFVFLRWLHGVHAKPERPSARLARSGPYHHPAPKV